MDSAGRQLQNLTLNEADDWDPVWSPDGTQIAFISERDGNPEVYVMDATGHNPHNISASIGKDGEPAWSPDGRYIAFSYRKAPSVIGWGAGCYAAWIVPAAVTTRVDAYGDGNDNVVLDAQGRPLCVSWELPFGQFVFIDWK